MVSPGSEESIPTIADARNAVIAWMSQAAVTALVIEHWRNPPPQLRQKTVGEVGSARFTMRWVRPALTFPADAPGAVRFGLAAEGGVQLPSGRTLTLDAFVTTTAAPQVTRDGSSCFARLSLARADPGMVRLSYAGQALPVDAGGMTTDLPTPDEARKLAASLGDALAQAFANLPELPLTYAFPCQSVEWRATRVTGGMLALGSDPTSLETLSFPSDADGAIFLSAGDLTAAFPLVAARADPLIVGDTTLTTRDLACSDGAVLLTLAPADDNVSHDIATLRAALELVDGRVIPALAPVDPADAGAAALAEDLTVQAWVGLFIRDTVIAAAAPVFGDTGDTLAWAWPVARTAMPLTVTFAPERAICNPMGLLLTGSLPTEANAADDVSDPPSIELAIVTPPDETKPERTVVVRATHARNADPPYDYAWWVTPEAALRAEHTPGLRVSLPALEKDPEEDPDDTVPRHRIAKRHIPDLITVTISLIDVFGRVARAELTLDPTTGAHAAAPATERRSMPLDGGPNGPTYLGTAYRSVPTPRNAVTRSSIWGMLAGALATFAILTTVLTVILVRSLAPSSNGKLNSTLPLPSPTVMVILTPQTTSAPTVTATVAAKPTPTFTPVPFGRFSEDTTSLTFTCDGSGNTLPLSFMLSNSGTAVLHWTARAIDTLGGQPWATIAPESGKLTPAQSIGITVTPQTPAFCQAPSTMVFRVQFTAPGAVPSTIVASHA